MFVHIFWRLLVFCVGALVGWQVGIIIAAWIPATAHLGKGYYLLITALVGGLVGYFAAPYLTVLPYQALRRKLGKASVRGLLMGVAGTFVGLVIAALLALPLSMLPGLWGQISPLVVALLLGFLGALTMILRERDILGFVGLVVGHDGLGKRHDITLLDTSVIIDGRVADICAAGFIRGTMLVPRFVLDELQHIADSPDVLRRNRGRRGLDILNRMQKDDRVPLDISDVDAPEIREVDGKLVKLAQEMDCPVLTNDYNLNRVAEIQGVQVLNINELANAVKAVVLPGETLRTRIIQEGKEHGQGVGYLDDGTMIVVEDGRRFLETEVTVVVTRVLQTVAGRMIFGQIQEAKHRSAN